MTIDKIIVEASSDLKNWNTCYDKQTFQEDKNLGVCLLKSLDWRKLVYSIFFKE
jgi:hypothetical protein